MVVILEAAQTSLVGYTNQLGVPQIPESELGFDLPLAARPAVPSKPCTDRIKGCDGKVNAFPLRSRVRSIVRQGGERGSESEGANAGEERLWG